MWVLWSAPPSKPWTCEQCGLGCPGPAHPPEGYHIPPSALGGAWDPTCRGGRKANFEAFSFIHSVASLSAVPMTLGMITLTAFTQWPSPRAQQYKAGHLAPWLSSAQCAATSEKPLPSFDPFWSYWPTESRSDSDQSLASYFYQATVSEDSSTKKILRMGKCKHALVLLAKYTLKFILAKQM